MKFKKSFKYSLKNLKRHSVIEEKLSFVINKEENKSLVLLNNNLSFYYIAMPLNRTLTN